MVRRALAFGVAAALLWGSAAQAAIPAGQGSRTQAAMYAEMTYQDGPKVQILDGLCEDLALVKECTPMTPGLKRAIEDTFARRIIWVSRRPHEGPEFWVFAPVRFNGDAATARYTWREPGDFGCLGGVRLRFKRTGGTWRSTSGMGWALCPAT